MRKPLGKIVSGNLHLALFALACVNRCVKSLVATYILLCVLFLDAGALGRDELVATFVNNAHADLTLITLWN